MNDQSSLIADTLHGSIMLSGFEKNIMVTTLFNRLHGIYQNSTAYLTFPANRTKRMEHSFGCMYLCGNIFYSSLCNSDEAILDSFISATQKEIGDTINELMSNGTQYKMKLGDSFKKMTEQYEKLEIQGGIYNYSMPANIIDASKRRAYVIMFEGIRVAALLHDIGHPPFSHICEAALKDLFKGLPEECNERERIFYDILREEVGESHQLHEELGIKISKRLLNSTVRDITEKQAKDDAIYQKQLFEILVTEIAIKILSEHNEFFKDVHAIIDGTLDGDRLDYVSRDPSNSGFSLGITEYDRLVAKMKLCKKESNFLFCPSVSVVKTVEDFLMRRWNLYKNIIYHHRVVKTDTLLQNIITNVARDYFEEKFIESGVTENPYILPYDISGLWKAIKKLPSDKEMAYAISQWDDTWLLTILKKSYFENYIDKENYVHDQLEEFLTNKKNYISLVKRKEEFEEIDIAVSEAISKKKNTLRRDIRRLEKNSKDVKGVTFDIDGYLKQVKEVIREAERRISDPEAKGLGFELWSIKKLLGLKDFTLVVDRMVSVMSKEEGDLFYAEKVLKEGIGKELHFYRDNGTSSELVSLDKISNIENVLNDDLRFAPFMFIYMRRKDKEFIDVEKKRAEIGTKLGEEIVNRVSEKIQTFLGAKST